MGELTQEGQLIAISVEGQEQDSLLLQGVMGVESISRPFLFQLDVVTPNADIDFTKILGQKALITLQTSDPENPRYFSGFVTRFSQADSSGGMHRYNMEVGPWISFLGLNVDSRIFHNLSIPDILKKIFDNSPAKQKDTVDTSKLTGTYNPVEYCVQYRETTLHFISRLMEHAGIFFYFTHTKDGHTLHLADDSTQLDDMPGQSKISYLYKNTGDMTEETIQSLQGKQGIKTGTHTLSNYNFKTPSTDLKTSEPSVISAGQNDDLEVFEYPSTHLTIDDGKALSKIRMQEQEATQHLVTGTGRSRGLMAGFKFTLQDHPENGTADRNIEYLVTEIKHMITVGTAFTTGIGGQSYMNTFTCIPASVPYRPPRITPKPVIHGIQNAFVVGKSATAKANAEDSDDGAGGEGEEIWVDKYGRVMVRFLWDRAGDCSCRVRVSQQWAGQAWGSMVIPRVGQEVLVSFLDGDPDRPIIMGGVYNGAYMPPYILPDNQTRSTFMTRSSPGGSASTYNELRFEDKKGAEQVFIRSQFDQDNYVTNDSREWIGNNRSLLVTKDQMESVGGDRHEQVTGKHIEKIGGDSNSNVTGNVNQKAGQNISIQAGQNLYEKSGQTYAHEAGQTIHLKAGMTVVIEAGTELCLKVGGNFIDINPSGVTIFGTMVMINSGGSAGSGPGSSPTDPAAPTDPDLADDGKSGTKRGSGTAQTSSTITSPGTSTPSVGSGSFSVAPPPAASPGSPAGALAGAAGAAAAAADQAVQQMSQAAQQAGNAAQQAVQQATQAATQAAQQLANEAQQAADQAQQAAQQAEQQAQQAVNQVTQQARQSYQQATQAVQQAQQQVQQASAQGQAAAQQALAQAQQQAQQTAQAAAQAVQQAQQQAQQVTQQAQQAAQQAQQQAQQVEQQAQQAEQQAQQQAQQAAKQAEQQVQQTEQQAQQQVQQGMQTVQQAQQQVQAAAKQAQQQAQQAAQQAQQAAQQAQQQAQQAAGQAQQAAKQAQQQAQQAAQQVQQAASGAQQQAQQSAQAAQQSASQAINQAMRGF